MKQWHQSTWQYLNHLEEIRQGVACEHIKRDTADVDVVGVHHYVSKGGARMGKEFDGYGTAVRERMKRVISQPAGWKPLNRKEESAAWIKWLIALIILFGIFELIFERIK